MPRTTSDTRISPGAESAQMRADIHGAAEEVVLLPDHVAGVETDVQSKLRRSAQRKAAASAVDRLCGGGERREDAVAGQFTIDGRATAFAFRHALVQPH